MKSVLITVGLLALLATAAIVVVNKTHEPELERFKIHIPKIHVPHIIQKLHIKNIGHCLSAVTSAASSCGAAYDAAGMNITGDIGCVKGILSAKSCAHIF